MISPFDVGLPLTIVLNRELAGGPLMFAGFWDAAIHVNASAPPWENATTMFCGGDQARKNCAVIDLAASLFHEMLHVCGATLGPGHGGNTGSGRVPDACDFTYVAENNLRWALAEFGPRSENSLLPPVFRRCRRLALRAFGYSRRSGRQTAISLGPLGVRFGIRTAGSAGALDDCCVPLPAMVDNHASLLKAC